MFGRKLAVGWPVALAVFVIAAGYYLAFLAPNDVERALVKDGETYIFLARSTATDIEVVPIRRVIASGLTLEEAAQETIGELLLGPTEFDTGNGFFSAINPATRLNYLRIEDGVAIVDFSPEIDQGVAGSATVLAIREQLDKTLLRLPGVESYRLTVDGGSREVVLEP